MGGFTSIHLKDTSEKNIAIQNAKLLEFGVPTKYHFYSMNDVRFEYATFLEGKGYFPDHQFPKYKINSFEDFKKYWNTKAIGETFCPNFGSLTLDVYYGRTSERATRLIGKYVIHNYMEIGKVDGSFTTFMERGMSTRDQNFLKNFAKFKI